VHMMLDPRAGPVSGDPDRLQQVVWNLLSNAVKFTPSDGQISVQLVSVNAHVEIVISDTGQGIAREFLPHIFDPFRQADGSKTRRHGGLGLGLAIARHLVELHGGAVKAESDGEGRGTKFTITLPCMGVAPGLSLRQQRSDVGTAYERSGELTGLRILSVEDDRDSREMLEMALRAEGAEVVSVGSVREALKVLNGNEWRPAVMVSDIGMPDEDGYDLIRQVRSRTPEEGGNLPAIALTGFAGNGERERLLGAGYQMHITKPVEWSSLILTIAGFAKEDRS
jgi:CheY-like chemotaxis protein/anti-sigma regulatory factor (Ser/Thr protein kinase)